jgi:hypothetical protein
VTKIATPCAACGSTTLMVGSDDSLTCSLIGCPDPLLTHRLLSDPLAREHVVTFKAESFDVQHPLTERGEDLVECGLHQHIRLLDGPPVKPGRYVATYVGESPEGEWTWREIEPLPEAT